MGKRNSETVNEAIVIAVLHGGMTTQAAATRFGRSQRWVRALVRRAQFEGIEAVRPRTTRPKGRITRVHQTGSRPVIILASGPQTMIIDRTTGEIIAEHHINPDKNYQPKTKQEEQ